MKRAVAALAIMLCALVVGIPAASVQAEPHRSRGRDRGWGQNQHHHHYWYKPRSNPSWGRPNPWGSFWGGVLGGWVGSQLNQATRPGREGEDVKGDYAPEANLEPWSKGWFDYCSSKYKSFDPETGRYMAYDGNRYFCK